VSEAVAAMSADQLRESASTALREQRLYAPAGNNAMEYYLALRDKAPSDPAVASALTDLMPYA
jgi:protein TonB